MTDYKLAPFEPTPENDEQIRSPAMTTNRSIYTPEEAGSGQWGICAKCGLGPTAEGHDGCLGTLPDPVMNACCGHGNDRQAYVQFWDGDNVEGADAIALQAKMIADREVKHDNQ